MVRLQAAAAVLSAKGAFGKQILEAGYRHFGSRLRRGIAWTGTMLLSVEWEFMRAAGVGRHSCVWGVAEMDAGKSICKLTEAPIICTTPLQGL